MNNKRIISKPRSIRHKKLERLDYLNGFSKQSVSKLREAYELAKQNNQKEGGEDE
ncbi:hypothetical protein [Thorsellia anophelis]|uniref:Uncharacterized protein n=1 Tax=Thorsellia anophelis DSM 18579 TaxID=1123402 RepID=A0A1I0D9K9_9GAMM|nr:hypothetical protein [Thorsellia anophelis]SET28896.1 hypothetical protein SAMN02583745_01912 [Thorsellia anophelis DSM 18579]